MNRGPIIRVAALVFIVILVVAMFVGCAKYNGDQAQFCTLLPKMPSFQSLALSSTTGSDAAAAKRMNVAAAEFRSLEQSAPRSIRSKVAALGDSAERIGKRLARPMANLPTVIYRDGRSVTIPSTTPVTDRRIGVFYDEFGAHPGTASAAVALLTYAQKDCGLNHLDTSLGLNGYGALSNYAPGIGGDVPGLSGGRGGIVSIPPASTTTSLPTVPVTPPS